MDGGQLEGEGGNCSRDVKNKKIRKKERKRRVGKKTNIESFCCKNYAIMKNEIVINDCNDRLKKYESQGNEDREMTISVVLLSIDL